MSRYWFQPKCYRCDNCGAEYSAVGSRLDNERPFPCNLCGFDVYPVWGDGDQASVRGDSRADVRTALEGLGYGVDEIHAVLVDLPTDGDVGGLLKDALRRLASGV
ncbi:MAG: hypothetical protein EBY44_04190 [Actinobacteria bacterium]|nr:hypothetical protein [Actinomycetota bacterium]